jgi:hypothetical protein
MRGVRPPPRRAVRAVIATREAARRAASRIGPDDLALFELSFSFVHSRLLGTFAELGLADHLDRPRTAQDLAAQLDLDADALHRVLRGLTLRGIVRLDRHGRFRLTRRGRLLRSDHPRSLRPWVRYLMLDATQDAWAALTQTVRTGEPAFPLVHGRSVWTRMAEHPEEERLFAASMRRVTEYDLPSITGGYPWPERGTVCDVAGGVGTVLAAILRTRPAVRGVLVDAAGVLAEAEGHLAAAGVRDRVELSRGDIFAGIEATADVYVLKDVLHDWDDERCRQILRTVRAAMPVGARVVLVETLQQPNVADPIASLADLQMLTQCDGGRQRSVPELHALLRAAGLEPGEARLTAGPALVEAYAA